LFVASIEAVSAFSIPYGNDVHIPSVFGKGRLYIIPEGYFCILELERWHGAQEFAYVREFGVEQCVRICGHPLIPEGKKHEDSCCFCAKGSRVYWMPSLNT
jgi:hypothetical protein